MSADGGDGQGDGAGAAETLDAEPPQKPLHIGDKVPDFTATSQLGPVQFYDYIDSSWAMVVGYPGDFTPVAATELGMIANLRKEFESRNVKVVALAANTDVDHTAFARDVDETQVRAALGGMLPSPGSSHPSRDLAQECEITFPLVAVRAVARCGPSAPSPGR